MDFFDELIGQHRAIELLQQAAARNRIAPAYLFIGTPGIGRTLGAKCFSTLLLCLGRSPTEYSRIQQKISSRNHPDLLWIVPTYLHQGNLITADQAAAIGLKRKSPPQIRIEQIREITQFLGRPPIHASRSIVAIEDAQTMTEAAANALLKTLEEPGRATIILIAPETDSLLPTLVSRCQRIPFSRLSPENMQRVLHFRGYEQILKYPELLAIAQGSPGEAISSFSQLQAIPTELGNQLLQPPSNELAALQLAKEVARQLDPEVQLWLVNYLQYHYWHLEREKNTIEQLEKTRQCLLSYVQPRLVWECTLLNIFASRF